VYKSSWREAAKAIIQEVLKETNGRTEKKIRKVLTEAYPFGARQYHPYKIWLDEIKVQRGKRKFNQKPSEIIPPNQYYIKF
jgi:hypothetical protein